MIIDIYKYSIGSSTLDNEPRLAENHQNSFCLLFMLTRPKSEPELPVLYVSLNLSCIESIIAVQNLLAGAGGLMRGVAGQKSPSGAHKKRSQLIS